MKTIYKKRLLYTFFLLLNICPFFSKGQTAGFTYQTAGGVLCSPVTVNFIQTSTGSPSGFSWSFGNGQFSTDANPSIIFSDAGTYSVKLVALYENQATEVTQDIVINPSISTILTVDRNYICTPGKIDFSTGETAPANSYLWNFGDSSAPVTTTTGNTSHIYPNFGTYKATVKVTAASGCSADDLSTITIQKPPVTGTVSPTQGCIPANANFTGNVTAPSGGLVTSYLWNFGDGTPIITTTANNVSHNYADTGSYLPILSINTNEGCTNTFAFQPIGFGTPPVNHIAYAKKAVYCGSETPVFVSKAGYANSYFWEYGDGNTQTVTDTITTHKYSTLGKKTIKVTPSFNGCKGTPISFQIDVIGVIAGFTFTNSCTDKKTFAFTNTTQGNQSIIAWDFGDGSPVSSNLNVTHTYPASGTFNTSLTVTDNITGCSDIFLATIYTANPILINTDKSICRNSPTIFTLQNNYSNSKASYIWNVVGLPTAANNNNPYTAEASVLGNFPTNYVIINNGNNYCADTIYLSHAIKVRGPNLNFSVPTSICSNAPVNITNTSGPFFPSDAVTLWYWNYGLGVKNDTIYQPRPFVYPYATTFNIKLVAKDITGCIDSLSKPIVVNSLPVLRIFPRIDTLCFGQSAKLKAFHSGKILWSPASLVSCATCDSIISKPNATTSLFATATNSFGCTSTDSSLIKVYAPFSVSSPKNPVLICRNDSVQINAGSSDKVIVWSPASDLSAPNIFNPIAYPKSTTTYTAEVTDSVGCFSGTASINVIVKTVPSVEAGPNLVLPYNSMFTFTPVYSNNVRSYNWSPAGTLSCINCAAPTGVNLNQQTYTIKATSDSGCVAKDSITVLVQCMFANILMPSAFSPNRDGKNDLYYPLTRGIKTITKFLIYNKYGQLLFEKRNFPPNDKSYGWDGSFRLQDQTTGSYVYMMEAVCDQGELITKKDSFLLLH